MMMVSVIVPCRNEARYIARCLDSIVAGDYPAEQLEVLVVDGRSEDGTRAIIEEYSRRHPVVRLVDNPQRTTPVALNLGIRAARGDVLVRMDAHVEYPSSYVPSLVATLLETGADNVGGVLITRPANETAIARAIATAMAHPFGVGNSHFRIGIREPRWVDTVPFFCCRREVFDRVGLFDEELTRHQDGEFNARLIQRGGRILLVPHVVSYYYARSSLRQLVRQCYQYGTFKPLVARKLGRVMTLRQLAPPSLVLTLAVTALLSPWVPAARVVCAATAAAYLIALLGFSVGAVRRTGLRGVVSLATVFPVMHFSYGFGFLRRTIELALGSTRRYAQLPLSR